MRKPFSARLFATSVLVLLLAAGLPLTPPAAAQTERFWDFRITDLRPVTRQDAGYATYGAFPAPGSFFDLEVRVQVYENTANNPSTDREVESFTGPFRVTATRVDSAAAGSRWHTIAGDANVGCQDSGQGNVRIDRGGKPFHLKYELGPTESGLATFRIEINKDCYAQDPYNPHPELGDQPGDNVAFVSVFVGKPPDFGILDTRCITGKPDCDAYGNRQGGPGPTLQNATGTSAGDPAFVICDDNRDSIDPTLDKQVCVARPTLTITDDPSLRDDVYFRVAVSAFGDNGLWTTTGKDDTGAMAGLRYLVYPHDPANPPQRIRPILVPIHFEVWKKHTTPDGPVYTFVQDLNLSNHGNQNPVSPNCPGTVTTRRCAQWLVRDDMDPSYTPVWTTSLDLHYLGGDFELRAYLNGAEKGHRTIGAKACGERELTNVPAPDADCSNNVGIFPFRVRAADLVAEITEAPGTETQLGLTDVVTVRGRVQNLGTLDVFQPFTGGTGAEGIQVVFFVEDRVPASIKFKNPATGAYTLDVWDPREKDGSGNPIPGVTLATGAAIEFEASFQMNRPGCGTTCSQYVAPGTRTARVAVDHANDEPEAEEGNNNATFQFRVEDTTAPTLGALKVYNPRGQEITGTVAQVNRGERVNFTIVVTDTDHSIQNVKVELKAPGATDFVACPNCTLVRWLLSGNDQTFSVELEEGLREIGDWSARVRATDPAGLASVSAVKALRVVPFQKTATWFYKDHVPPDAGATCPPFCPEDDVDYFPSNRTVLAYRAPPLDWPILPRWNFTDDQRNLTGHEPAWTSNGTRLRIEPPDGNWTDYWVENDVVLVAKSRFGNVENRYGTAERPYNFSAPWMDYQADHDQPDGDAPPPPCKDASCSRRERDTEFRLPIVFGASDIGRWNVTLNVTDVGGASREYRTHFFIRDQEPVGNISLLKANGHREDAMFLRAGMNVTLSVNATDDQGFDENSTVWLNFTRVVADGSAPTWVNLSTGPCDDTDGDNACTFHKRIHVKSSKNGGDLTMAGRWNLTAWVVDKWGNWGLVDEQTDGRPLYVLVNDTVRATLATRTSFGTSQPEEEIGSNVTFWARVADDLDPKVYLTVREGNTLHVNEALMKDGDKDGNYTFVKAFDAAGTLEYRVRVVDSNATRTPDVSDPKTIVISENLPPRVDVMLANVPEHGYFAKAAPVLEFKVYDTAQGVASASIKLQVDGQNATTIERTAADGGKAYVVRYTHDPSRPFVHGQVVNVTLAAEDLSVPPKPMTLALNFTVDAIAPKSRVIAFEPRYAASESDVWNVSLATRFTPVSDDAEDGLATGVKEIRYQFIRNGPGREFVLNGTTFPMSDLPANQNVGNADYFVRVIGVDAVGNKEIGSTTNTLRVFLDQVPPELVRSKLKNTGRLVNATFDDGGSGVKSARMHYRYDSGAFASLDMVRQADGTWTATIPVNPNAKNACYYLDARDNVGNAKQFGDEQSPPWCFPIGNRPPTVSILAPGDGQTVSGSVTLRWEASDPDGDPLTYKIYYKPSTGTTEGELRTLEGETQSYVVTTSSLGPDGRYTLRVTASDGHFFEEDAVEIEVLNSRKVLDGHNANKPVVKPGEGFCYTAKVNKQGVAVVEARVFRGGTQVGTFAMADTGVKPCDVNAGDGVYAAELSFDEAGAYDVEVYVRYVEGGDAKEVTERENGVFTVKLSAIDIPGRYPILFGAFVALGVAVFAVGGFGVWRRWR